MKTRRVVIAGAVLIGMLSPVSGAAEDTQVMSGLAETARSAMAVLRCTLEDELGARTVAGLATCIKAGPNAVFITNALDSRIHPEYYRDFVLEVPDMEGTTVKAELMGIDEETNLSFVRATEPHDWSVVRFLPRAGLTIGQQVYSAGLLPRDSGGLVYVGKANIAAILRVPQQLAYVTGGWLTSSGSPVFDDQGRAIGLVAGGRFLPYQIILNNRAQRVNMRCEQQAGYFIPVDEFGHVFANIPVSPDQARRIPWIGVLNFSGVAKEVAEIMNLQGPGVMIDQVIEGQVADKAGIQDRDVIVALNGKPIEQLSSPDLTARNFERLLTRMSAGENVTLTLRRGDQQLDVTLTLEPIPPRPYEAQRFVSRELGFLVREKVMLDRYIDKSSTAKLPGLLTVLVAPESPAANAGLKQGDLVTYLNGQPVRTVGVFKQIVERALSADQPGPVNMVVRRGDADVALTIQPRSP